MTSEASSVTVDMVESGSGERGIEDIASWGERARMSNCCLEALGGGLGPGEAAPLALTTGEWDWRFSGLSHSNSDSWELYGKCVSCNEQWKHPRFENNPKMSYLNLVTVTVHCFGVGVVSMVGKMFLFGSVSL